MPREPRIGNDTLLQVVLCAMFLGWVFGILTAAWVIPPVVCGP